MIVSINQPAYLPWLGYFHRIAQSDRHIVLDHVQFEKNSFTNRTRVRTADGWTWLTVPVLAKGRFGDLAIRTVEIDNQTKWRDKHWRTLRQNYGKAPHFAAHAPFFESLYAREWTQLAPLCDVVTRYLLDALGIRTPVCTSGEAGPEGVKDALILNLCKGAGATTYLSGMHGRDYLRLEPFEEAGIRVAFQDYGHPIYPQVRKGFEPYMSAVDLIFNMGPESFQILVSGQEQAIT